MASLTCRASGDPPSIVSFPSKKTVFEGEPHQWSVLAVGTEPLIYQWRRDGLELGGETNATLTWQAVGPGDAGGYQVVVTNGWGAVTSEVAVLVVKGLEEPRYLAPQGGWAYYLNGDAAAGSATAALDGQWNHNNASDSWFGDGRGAGNGLAGGIGSTNGILTLEDAVTSGTSSVDNRRYYLTHDLSGDAGVTNGATILDDGVTMVFRARLTPGAGEDPLTELRDAPNGWMNLSGGKGMIGIRQSGGGGMIISFSLNQRVEDTGIASYFDFGAPGLHFNALNGNTRSSFVDPGGGGALRLLGLDPELFHEFWVTVEGNGGDPGTHRVTVYLDGGREGAVFNVTGGTGSDGPFSDYLALGLSGTPQRGAFDLDFLGYRPGVFVPPAYDEPPTIVTQPEGAVVLPGETIEFVAVVEGTPQISFQWYRDGVLVEGATAPSYRTEALTLADDGASYTLVASNACGTATSSPPARVTILVPPVVTEPPSDLTVTNGGVAFFEVGVASAGPVQYQWRRGGAPLDGGTNRVYQLDPALESDAGSYDVVVLNDAGSVTSAVAVLTVKLQDFGDAPGPLYPTETGQGGARHLLGGDIWLGAVVDGEVDGQSDFLALGDDLAGLGDEDGVLFGTLIIGEESMVSVVASTTGVLNAWIDFELNLSWADDGDQVFTNVVLAPGTNSLQLRVPMGSVPAATYSRFRFSSVGDLDVTGPAPDGEVEDYLVTLNPSADLIVTAGAAPEPVAAGSNLVYSVTVSNAGPSMATAGLLGDLLPESVTFVSASSSGGPCVLESGEVLCNLNIIPPGGVARVTIEVIPTLSGTVSNQIVVQLSDYDPDVSNNTGWVLSEVLDPPRIAVQPMSVVLTNGSDAVFTVEAEGAGPLFYQWFHDGTLLAGGTGTSLTVPGAGPGEAGSYSVVVTNEVGAVESVGAVLTVLIPPEIVLQAGSRTNLAGGEAAFTVVATGTEPLRYQWYFGSGTAIPGGTNSTLHLSDVQAGDAGEYHVEVRNEAGVVAGVPVVLTVWEVDFGDAPEPGYPVRLADDGARHFIVSGVHLGAVVDAEPEGLGDGLASGDDADGLDDEDGVFFGTPMVVGQGATIEVAVSTNGFLNAWLDYNHDGDWDDSGEHAIEDAPMVTGTNLVEFTLPAEAEAGLTFARFRFDTAGGLSVFGAAADGEVEDYGVVVVGAVDLGVGGTSVPATVVTGSNVVYTLVVTNRGPSQAGMLSLQNLLPSGAEFVSVAATQGSCSFEEGVLSCSLGALPEGGVVTLTVMARLTLAGVATNRVAVASGEVEVGPGDELFEIRTPVLDFPVVLLSPSDLVVSNGLTAIFAVEAVGSELSYQWRVDGVALVGETNAELVIAAAGLSDAGIYSAWVSNRVGVAVSEGAVLKVLAVPEITRQPENVLAIAGSNVTFSVEATGTSPLGYQWRFNGIELPGETERELVLVSVGGAEEGSYTVVVSNEVGQVASGAAVLTVEFPPRITLQPEGATVRAGLGHLFSSAANGTLPLGYQWYFEGTNAIAGETGETLALSALVPGDSGAYTLVVSNSIAVVTSLVAVLLVEPWDYGDARDPSYPTLEAFGGARHRIVEGIHLGSSVDYEPDGRQSFQADGDDLDGLDDEDGVRFPLPVRVGQTGIVDVEASTDGRLDAWIDFGQTGLLGDPGDRIFSERMVTAGVNRLEFAVPTIAATGPTVGRFRFSTTGGYSFDGPAVDGEVEDHVLEVVPGFDLAVRSAGVPESVFIGAGLTYSLTVTNRRGLTATSVVLRDVLPPNVEFVSVTASQGSCSHQGGVVTCSLGGVIGGGSVLVLVEVMPLHGGPATNRVSISAAEYDPDRGNDSLVDLTLVRAIVGPAFNFNPIALVSTGAAGLYPSTIQVSGVESIVYDVAVTLSNVSHSFPDDLDVLLVGPSGESVILMSDAGGGGILDRATFTFRDSAPLPLADSGQLLEGTVRPSNFELEPDLFPAPAPPGPYGETLSVFRGTDPNGVWSLFVVDDFEDDFGTVNDGWGLTIVTLGPLADLEVREVAAPVPVAVGSNLTYTVTVPNLGPATASGVVMEDVLPADVRLLSVVPSQGNCMTSNGVIRCELGAIPALSSAGVVIMLVSDEVGQLTNRLSVAAAELDLNPLNDVHVSAVRVAPVTDLELSAAAVPDRILLGDTLTYRWGVTNVLSSLATGVLLRDELPVGAELVGARVSAGSCTSSGGVLECDLGVLGSGDGATVEVTILPTRMGTLTNTVMVTSQEVDVSPQDNGRVLTTAALVVFGALVAGEALAIPEQGMAGIYPSTLTVMGVTGTVYSVGVTLYGLSHAVPDDLDILLRGPGGETVVLLSDTGGATPAADVNLVFRDAAGGALPEEGPLVSGEYAPTDFGVGEDVFPAPAPVGPYGVSLGVFEGMDPNGVWSLYVVDDGAGGGGMLAGGWGLELTLGGSLADLAVMQAAFPEPTAVGSNLVYSITVSNLGPGTAYGVTVTNRLAGVPSLVEGVGEGCVMEGDVLRCGVGTLLAGEATEVQLRVVPTEAGELEHWVGVVGLSQDLNPGNDSSTVTSRVRNPPQVTRRPETQVVINGDSVNFTVEVRGDPPFEYQWLFEGEVISGATNEILTLGGVGVGQSGGYSVRVVNDVGGDLSSAADLTILVRPLISAIADQAIDEDGMLPAVAFTVEDYETRAVDLEVTVSSSNPTLVPASNLIVSGLQTNRTLTVTPVANGSGLVQITLAVVDDDGLVATTYFLLTVRAVNDPPTISGIPDFDVSQDGLRTVPFEVGDLETPLEQLVLSAHSSNQSLLPTGSILFGGAGRQRRITLIPAVGQSGVTMVTLEVTDTGMASAADTFVVTVKPDSPPTMSAIGAQATQEDVPTGLISVTVEDQETPAAELVMGGMASDPGLVPASNIQFGGVGSGRTVRLIPAANRSGSTEISVWVMDRSGLAVTNRFVLTVLSVNDPPLISQLAGQTVERDGVIGLPVSVSDQETTWSNLLLSGTSSDPTLVGPGGIEFGGSGGMRRVSIRPEPGKTGRTTISIVVTDSAGLGATNRFTLDVVERPGAPVVTRQPRHLTVPEGLGGTFEVGAAGTPPLAYQWQFAGLNLPGATNSMLRLTNLDLQAAGLYTVVVSNAFGSTLGGPALLEILPGQSAAPGRTLIATGSVWRYLDTGMTPSEGWKGLRFDDSDWLSGPAELGYGDASQGRPEATLIGFGADPGNKFITTYFRRSFDVSVPDGYLGLKLRLLRDDGAVVYLNGTEVTRDNLPAGAIDGGTLALTNVVGTEEATYRAVEVDPALLVPGKNVVAVEVHQVSADSTDLSFDFELAGTVAVTALPTISPIDDQMVDEDTRLTLPLTISHPSTEPVRWLLSASSSNPALLPESNILFEGRDAERTVTLVPSPDEHGETLVTVEVRVEGVTASESFVLTVNPVNDAPTLGEILDVSVEKGSEVQVLLTEISHGAGNEAGGELVINAESSDSSRVGIGSRTYTSPNPTGVQRVRGLEVGVETVTVVVEEEGELLNREVRRSFEVYVHENNGVPGISSLASVEIDEGGSTGPIPFQVMDDLTPAADLELRARSLDERLVPSSNITFGGSGSNRTVTVTPVANGFGEALISVMAVDGGGGMAMETFTVTVTPIDDVPTISGILDQFVDEDSGSLVVPFQVWDVETPASQLRVTAEATDIELLAQLAVGGSGTNRSLLLTPANDLEGKTWVTVMADDGQEVGVSTFLLTVEGVNDLPEISDIPDQEVDEDGGTGVIGFVVWDEETDAGELMVAVSSSNPELVDGEGVQLGGGGTNRTLVVTPNPDEFGLVVLTVTVTDGNGSVARDSFLLRIHPINDAPGFDPVADVVLEPGSGWVSLDVTGVHYGVENENQELALSARSSDPSLIPDPVIDYLSPDAVGTLRFLPVAGREGKATITVVVSDGQEVDGVATGTFDMYVSESPLVVGQPRSQTVRLGQSFVLTVGVTGTRPFNYEWRKNGVPVPGKTNAALAVLSAQLADAGDYSVVVRSVSGEDTSAVAVVRVLDNPVIVDVDAGATVTVYFSTLPRLIYTLEFSDDLSLSGWNELGQLIGDGTVRFLRDSSPEAAFRVYRVRAE